MQDSFRSLSAPGLGAQQATTAVVEVLEGRPGLTVHVVSPGRINVSSSRRPPWAVVACIATVWIAGLGLLFLLVRRTDSGEITVTDGPRGCVVTLPSIVDASAGAALAEVLAPGEVPVLAPPVAPADADDLEGRTIARSVALPPPPDVATPVAAPPRVELAFDDGAVAVEVGRTLILGREPSPTGQADVRVVPGDAATVSKSHLKVDFDGVGVTIEDLGSTNGSAVRRPDAGARSVPLAPGTPVSVDPGDVVTMGAVTFVVGASATRAGGRQRTDGAIEAIDT